MVPKIVHDISMILVIIGGLNWGLVGAIDVNVVELLLSAVPVAVTVVYVLVGLAAVYVGVKYVGQLVGKSTSV